MTIDREFQVAETAQLDVRVQSGRVEVVEAAPGEVRVTVDTSDPNFIVEQRGDLIVVSSDKNTSWFSRGSAYVVIAAPPSSDAVVTTATARVETQVHLANIDIKTASGDVDIESATSLDVKTASADARIRTVEGPLRFKSASGDLFVTNSARGPVSVASASGDIHIENAQGALDINTASGDVEVSRFAGPKASFKSMSGDARIGVPSGTKLELDASLLSGRLHLPEPEATKTPIRRNMSVKAKMVSGDLRFDRLQD